MSNGTIDLTPDRRTLLIRFPYREDLVEEVRLIPGRRWDPRARVWTVPILQLDLVVKTFSPLGFDLTPEVSGLVDPENGTVDKPRLPFGETVAAAEAPPRGLGILALNERVRCALRGSFKDPVWVVGEILDFDKTRNRKHLFFSLVEKQGEHTQVQARADVVMFAGTRERLRPVLEHADTGLQLRDGIQIRALVRIDLYPQSGRYQLVLEDIDPSFTLGKMALSREAVLGELRQTGLANRNATRPLPIPPLRIGVLTSPDSDGWNDFRRQLESSGLGFAVTCYAIRVQGTELKPTMLAGLRWFAQRHARYDVLCVLRGGGSRSELAWFDDRDLAMAVARHPLKILCGIGHERDQSVLDIIAHSEKTPTAVGAFLVSAVGEATAALDDAQRQLVQQARDIVATERRRLDRWGDDLGRAISARVAGDRERLTQAPARLRRAVRALIERRRDRLAQGQRDLGRHARLSLERATTRLAARQERCRLLDPARVLERGYAIVEKPGGGIVQTAGAVHPGMKLDIRFRDGHARVTATDVTRDDEDDRTSESE